MDRLPRPGDLYRHFTNKIYQIASVAVHAQTGEQLVVYQEMFGEFRVYADSLAHFFEETDVKKYPQAAQQYVFEKVEKEQLKKTVHSTQTARPEFAKMVSESGMRMQYSSESGIRTQNLQESGQHTQSVQESEPDMQRSSESDSSTANLPEAGLHMQSPSGARPHTQSPAESGRALRQESSGEDSYYYEKRRRQIEEREQRRGLFRKPKRHESATEELRANPCLLKFLEADTYEERYQVLNEIQDDITDRLIDDMAVVLDVVIPEGPLNDRFHQLRNIILTRQKYETSRFR